MTIRRVGVASGVLVVALAAWVVVVGQTRGMDGGPTTDLGGAGRFVGLWVTMTAAMMLPSAAPAVLLVDRFSPRATPLFLAGYLVAWTAFGVGAYAVVRLALAAGLGGWHASGPLVVAAGAYQLTPLKRACLRRCRNPLGFVRAHAGESALRMGAEHGAHCVGCCAGLMAVLFALGVMSLLWMAVVATVVAAEKVAPRGDRLATPLALVLVVAGTWLTLA